MHSSTTHLYFYCQNNTLIPGFTVKQSLYDLNAELQLQSNAVIKYLFSC